MQKGKSIISLPLFIGMVLSIAIHSGALYGNSLHAQAQPQLQSGRRVVQLTFPSSLSTGSSSDEQVSSEIRHDQQPLHQPPSLPEPAEEHDQTDSAPVEEQVANSPADEGVTSAARISSGTIPSYPRFSQLRGEEGTVLLSIEVLATGKAGRIEVLKSSGYQRLDRAAVKSAQDADYIPAHKLGRRVDSQLIQPMSFELRGLSE